MYGAIAAAGPDRLLYVQRDGDCLLFDLESGEIVDAWSPYPFTPEQIEIAACAIDDDAVFLADSKHNRVRVFDLEGRPLGRIGGHATPGIRMQDDAGILAEPVDVTLWHDDVFVVSSGEDQEHAVQRFARDGTYLATLPHPLGGYYRAHGAAVIGNELWVAETEGSAIRRYGSDNAFLGDVKLHTELQRPFRLCGDGYDGVFLLLAPEGEEEQEATGVARLERDGTFGGWAVPGGTVQLPFDIAVLPDGRFCVADLPFGEAPDVRVQLFASDGRPIKTLFDDRVHLGAVRSGYQPSSALRRAELAHFRKQEDAKDLYREALKADPEDVRAWGGLGALLEHVLEDGPSAEQAYREAIRWGGSEPDFLARITRIWQRGGDAEGAVPKLQELLESAHPPEEADRWTDDLADWFLEIRGPMTGSHGQES